MHRLLLVAGDHEPRELDRGRRLDTSGRREVELFIKWHSCLTISRCECKTGRVLMNTDIRARLAELRIDELIAAAERERLARSARPPRTLLRVRALRLAARGLRVEREFSAARVPSRAGR